jgi:hypothetical protein
LLLLSSYSCFTIFFQKGNEVILYNVYRDHSTPVAKATILSTDRKKVVGGHELGTECCEVVVNYITKRGAMLPRPIGNVTTMGQAQGRSIAWPYKHVGLFCFIHNADNQILSQVSKKALRHM